MSEIGLAAQVSLSASAESAPAVRAEQIRPGPERLLVRRFKKAEFTKGGIQLPETSREVSQFGQVVAVGPKVPDLQVGQFVLFSGYAAPVVATDDWKDNLVIIKHFDVLGVIESGQALDVVPT